MSSSAKEIVLRSQYVEMIQSARKESDKFNNRLKLITSIALFALSGAAITFGIMYDMYLLTEVGEEVFVLGGGLFGHYLYCCFKHKVDFLPFIKDPQEDEKSSGGSGNTSNNWRGLIITNNGGSITIVTSDSRERESREKVS